MADGIHFRLNPTTVADFRATLKQYVRVSKRTLPEICNSKAFYIALRAIIETPKANKLAIGKGLSRLIYDFSGDRRSFKTAKRFGRFGQEYEVPIAALLVNKLRGERNLPGLYGPAMKKAITQLIAVRQRSVAFLKSGWIPAVKKLAIVVKNKSGAPPLERDVKVIGRPKGRAIPARDGMVVTALIENAIGSEGANRGKTDAMVKYAMPALERSIAYESATTREIIAQRLKEAAHSVGIKTR